VTQLAGEDEVRNIISRYLLIMEKKASLGGARKPKTYSSLVSLESTLPPTGFPVFPQHTGKRRASLCSSHLPSKKSKLVTSPILEQIVESDLDKFALKIPIRPVVLPVHQRHNKAEFSSDGKALVISEKSSDTKLRLNKESDIKVNDNIPKGSPSSEKIKDGNILMKPANSILKSPKTKW
jgi:hypothetical protein